MPGKVPDRWEDYEPIKTCVAGTRFVAFKVPLEQNICDRIEKEKWFTPDILVKRLAEDHLQLGLVVDLTNTNRYYNPRELIRHGIEHIKIKTEGKQVPSRSVQNRFKSAVKDFLQRYPNQDSLIGVHCTHGLNRTGYLICRYMVDEMGFKPDEAISAFNEARGYPIERENYTDDLKGIRGSEAVEDEGYARSGQRHHHHNRNQGFDRGPPPHMNYPPHNGYNHNGYNHFGYPHDAPGSYQCGPGAYPQSYHGENNYGRSSYDGYQSRSQGGYDRREGYYSNQGNRDRARLPYGPNRGYGYDHHNSRHGYNQSRRDYVDSDQPWR